MEKKIEEIITNEQIQELKESGFEVVASAYITNLHERYFTEEALRMIRKQGYDAGYDSGFERGKRNSHLNMH